MVKPFLFSKLKPLKKNIFFENQSWQPGECQFATNCQNINPLPVDKMSVSTWWQNVDLPQWQNVDLPLIDKTSIRIWANAYECRMCVCSWSKWTRWETHMLDRIATKTALAFWSRFRNVKFFNTMMVMCIMCRIYLSKIQNVLVLMDLFC